MDRYKDATTRISERGKTTRQTKINARVKQGCPLPPLLFDLIVDELLGEVLKLKAGVGINHNLPCCMAFADDLGLITKERIHMLILIERYKKYFDEKGLNVNTEKCASLRVVPVPKKQSMKVMMKQHRQWGDETIPPMTFKELPRYLGVDIKSDVWLPRALWETSLSNLTKAHLNLV